MKRIALALLLLSATADASTLVRNVNGYTLDNAGKLQRFAALLIDDSGRVAALVASGAPLPGADAVIDGQGKTMLPGLIDAHGHVMDLGAQALALDLTGTGSLAVAQAALKAYAAANPGSGWITGGGWNQEIWQLGRFPTAAELDVVVADRPVWLDRVDGHAGWANSRALALAGVTAATADPPGGRIERDATGQPTGVLVDKARALVARVVPPPTPEQADAALAKALQIMASVGLTGVGDAGVSPEDFARYQRFAAAGRLSARIYAMAGGMDALAQIAPAPLRWAGDDRLAMMSVKLYADGALGSRGAYLLAPYSDMPGGQGLRFRTPAEMTADVQSAAARGFQVNVHAIGDGANAEVLDSFSTIKPNDRKALRLRIEHAQVVAPADLGRFATLGIIASMQPTHATSDKNMAQARIGATRIKGAYAWATLIKSGARFAGGSDFPVESPNPFYGLHAAVTRQDHDNQPPGGWYANEALSRIQALDAFTRGAAYANFAEGFSGTLSRGKWADFVLIDRDIFTVPAAEIWSTKVESTWLAGKPVYTRPAAALP